MFILLCCEATRPRVAWLGAILPLVLLLGLATRSLAAEGDAPGAQKVWRGTWSNCKYKTTGPLRCTAARQDKHTASAEFEGTFMGDPFRYSVEVTTKPEGDRMVVEGTAQLDGDKYEWSGYVRGRLFYGQYRSLKGNNGEFRLEESK